MDYNKFIGKRAGELKPSGIRKFFDIAGKVEGAISLGVGEPDFITSWDIRKDVIASIQQGKTQYTSNMGMPKLRELISKYLNVRYQLDYEKDTEILVTVGASEAVDLSMRAFVDEGDEILIPEPSYVAYAPAVKLAGGVPIAVKTLVENNFKIQPSELEKAITSKTKAVLLSYPNNPTGAILTKSELEAIASVIIEKDIMCISDEIYSELTYGRTHVSMASIENMRERTVLINGFSKSFAMTGWRIGYVAAPKELIDPMFKIHQYCIMCASTMSQYAGVSALEQGFSDDFALVEDMRGQYDIRRKFLLAFFRSVGVEVFEPEGAFYIFPSTKSFGIDGEEFANKLLESEKVAVVPGSAFGESGKWHIRISYAYSLKSLQIATERIRRFIEELRK